MAGKVKTETARSVARTVSARLGREVNDKRVRGWVRENVAAFDDDGYTAHVYSAAQAKAIVDGMVKSAGKGRSAAASTGRKGSARKAAKATRARKATPTAPASDAS